MRNDRITAKKTYRILAVLIVCSFLCSCGKREEAGAERVEKTAAEEEKEEQWEKGYDLPIDEKEREEAEKDCEEIMQLIFDSYTHADKVGESAAVISDETLLEMRDKIGKAGYSVTSSVTYADMRNYEGIERFLENCMEGTGGSAVIYKVHNEGVERLKYIFDGTEMYVLGVGSIWKNENRAGIEYSSYTRIQEWKYTDKGWFCYKVCVPEPPEVTEIFDGSCLIRVKPMAVEQREMSERCVQGLGYQGNNLLWSNWDAAHMDKLDYNGVYEYLYEMKYKEAFQTGNEFNGIPKAEFERLMMEYLPVTAEQIREYAAFDEEHQTYVWEPFGYYSSTHTFFETSLPEVTDVKANDDGSVTLTVDAVCSVMLCNDAVITHKLTVRLSEDGGVRYLGNEIQNGREKELPDYRYRTGKSE